MKRLPCGAYRIVDEHQHKGNDQHDAEAVCHHAADDRACDDEAEQVGKQAGDTECDEVQRQRQGDEQRADQRIDAGQNSSRADQQHGCCGGQPSDSHKEQQYSVV